MINRIFLTIISTFILMSCSGNKNFSIELTFNDDSRELITLTYATGYGDIQRLTVPIENNKAVFEGESSEWTTAYLTKTNNEPIAICIVKNGTHMKIEVGDGEYPELKIKGSKPSQELYEFIVANRNSILAGETDSVNTRIANFITGNPNNPLSTLLLVDFYNAADNEIGADSLLTSINTDVRPNTMLRNFGAVNGSLLAAKPERIYPFTIFTATDGFTNVRPGDHRQNLIAILPSQPKSRDKYITKLKKINEYADTLRLHTLEISFAPDSARWRNSIAADSASWVQAWSPGNAAATPIRRLTIPREPFFILIDSTGMQIYRGSNLDEAIETARQNLKPITPNAR